jgi:hypothetical protein
MNKETEELRILMAEVYRNGLNIYALVNRIQGVTSYSLPPSLIEKICKEYLKYKDTIKSPWAWGEKVFKLIRDQAYASGVESKNKVEFKQVNTELMEKLFGDKKWN